MIKGILAGVLALGLGGCVTTQLSLIKPGMTYQSLAADRYQCLQENQHYVSAGSIGGNYSGGSGGYGGGYVTAPKVSEGMYVACMQARGYVAQRVEASDEAKQADAVRTMRCAGATLAQQGGLLGALACGMHQ